MKEKTKEKLNPNTLKQYYEYEIKTIDGEIHKHETQFKVQLALGGENLSFSVGNGWGVIAYNYRNVIYVKETLFPDGR